MKRLIFKRITLINFGMHKKLTIKFSPKITCIVGDNFSGKSTIVRAIRWVCLNKPSGDSIINWDSKQAKVILTTNKGKVIRIKSKTRNEYILKIKGKKQVYRSFGTGVPDPIKNFLRFSDVNIQGQFDGLFWLSESPPEVNRQLNQIVSLDLMDRTTSNLNSELRKASSNVKVSKQRIAELTEDRKTLKSSIEAQRELKPITQLCAEHTKAASELRSLQCLFKTWSKAKKRSKKPPSFKQVESIYTQWQSLRKELSDLNSMMYRYRTAAERTRQLLKQHNKLEMELEKKSKGRCPLCNQKLRKKEVSQ